MRVQQFLELVKNEKIEEAVGLARQHLAPNAGKTRILHNEYDALAPKPKAWTPSLQIQTLDPKP